MDQNDYHWDSSNTEFYTTFYWIYIFNVPFYETAYRAYIKFPFVYSGYGCRVIYFMYLQLFLRRILFRCTHVNSAWPSDLSQFYNQFSVFLFNFFHKATRIVLFEKQKLKMYSHSARIQQWHKIYVHDINQCNILNILVY